MGFFSKLKSNLNHGGIKIDLNVPGSAPCGSAVPVTVNLTASDAQTINKITVELQMVSTSNTNRSTFDSTNNAPVGDQVRTDVLAKVEATESFVIAAGENKTVTLQLAIPADAAAFDTMGGALGGVMQTLSSLSPNHVSRLYKIYVHADVEGIKLDPGTHQNIQLLPATAAVSTSTPPGVV